MSFVQSKNLEFLLFISNVFRLIQVYIQRTKGCDHIVCLRCKTEFCYKCGGRFRDIKFIGKHFS